MDRFKIKVTFLIAELSFSVIFMFLHPNTNSRKKVEKTLDAVEGAKNHNRVVVRVLVIFLCTPTNYTLN